MVVNKRKKNTRQRATQTHGWGAKKKHRGAGHRGGRGNAGTGKRGDAKKPSIWNNPKYFGKFGFASRKKSIKALNLTALECLIQKLEQKGQLKKTGNKYNIDLHSLGYGKLLGSGKITFVVDITVERATQKAIDKIKKIGGDVKVLESAEEFESTSEEFEESGEDSE